ncbi:MAG TPA: DMT family transporter, partial [Gammaproteobacteria bacterium]
QLLGLVLSLGGAGWIIVRGEPAHLLALGTPGDLWVLAAALTWAIYSAWLRRRPAGLEPLQFLLALVLFGWPVLLPFYLLEHAGGRVMTPDLPTLLLVLYVGVFASILAYVAWNHGVGRVGANRAGVFMHLMPVFSTLLAIALLGERLQLYHAVGIVLIGSGVALAARRPPAPEA